MAKTILVGGFGPGISTAVAEIFGKQGFAVALVARNGDRLGAGVKALEAKGIKAAGFPADLGDPAAARAVVEKVRAAMGPITVLQWTAYGNGAGDLLTADDAALRGVFDVAITGLLAAVQAALPDLKKERDAAVLVTNGGFGFPDPAVDAMGVKYNAMGLSVANAAKNKLVGLLSAKLKDDGVYVGQVMVTGSVKGTTFDDGSATLEAATVANAFWKIYSERKETTARV